MGSFNKRRVFRNSEKALQTKKNPGDVTIDIDSIVLKNGGTSYVIRQEYVYSVFNHLRLASKTKMQNSGHSENVTGPEYIHYIPDT